ncbi:uncharacterized protein Z519_11286 [Cladophialophora bantiana CBS 173.52]|uniref:Uncharacterized protein n=1 Tax=Cladophialophora bantiana (strain ATCC 10958 / CBS 173.52 / CDC B-1940 / NIH 8579) TaxID=1442370 RepID=A0A0D2HB87_CLAB1|nr:uncharacterized protein Z519_11286 [Cladophialophora bantiana CBS 173.52]KIW88175.1 hypothetical protein Z519_11286 [Cladophialophora bantiana CBS 173.52]
MQRNYRRMRETLFDLYTERDALPWYFRTTAIAASWLALGGYIVFSLVFTSAEENIKVSRTFLTVLAAVFLILGYGAITAIAYFSRSLLFLFDAVLLPILTSSFMGVFVTVMNHALHKRFPIPTQVYIYVPLVIACATTIGTGVLSYITFRKLSKIKELDRQRRQHVQRWDRSSYVSYGDAASTTELIPMNPWTANNIPEDEAQRRQLLRLLLTRDSAESPNHRNSQSTYHITLPGEEAGSDRLEVAQPDTRPRSGSLPASTGKWQILNKLSRDRSPATDNGASKNLRERRREEIERSSVLLTPGTEPGTWPQTPGSSPSQTVSYSPNPVWTGSTRYA